MFTINIDLLIINVLKLEVNLPLQPKYFLRKINCISQSLPNFFGIFKNKFIASMWIEMVVDAVVMRWKCFKGKSGWYIVYYLPVSYSW